MENQHGELYELSSLSSDELACFCEGEVCKPSCDKACYCEKCPRAMPYEERKWPCNLSHLVSNLVAMGFDKKMSEKALVTA